MAEILGLEHQSLWQKLNFFMHYPDKIVQIGPIFYWIYIQKYKQTDKQIIHIDLPSTMNLH